ncbi:hypothetical protein IU449_10245 [Nocardia higoensis]|uniref:Mobilization protein n=1 Tax=Nocardia higoensis TaxID=228599 RepID=A0ABS0D8W6_9NOCA|nr:hypothetical protein [Nocardia higoensis]MBF6354921.1 hypothetical protein [Nocardia higoensis]
MAQLRGETRANGWQHEQSIVLGPDKGKTRIHDTARTNAAGGRDFTEYKSGVRVPGDAHTLNQIALDRKVLSTDPHATGTWVMREGAADRAVRQQLEGLQRDFPGRFQVVEVSRAEAEKARKLGRALEQQAVGVQRELHNIPELIRQQQQQRESKTRVQEAAARAIARQQAQRTAEQARRHELARIQAARDQLLERLPPDVARVLEVSMPPVERELDREPATPGSGMTRAGREARAQERERGRDARGR